MRWALQGKSNGLRGKSSGVRSASRKVETAPRKVFGASRKVVNLIALLLLSSCATPRAFPTVTQHLDPVCETSEYRRSDARIEWEDPREVVPLDVDTGVRFTRGRCDDGVCQGD